MWDYRAAGLGRQKKAGQKALESAEEDVESHLKKLANGVSLEFSPEPEADTTRKMRLLRLRSEIALGTYRISTEALADRMLSRAAEARAAHQRMYSV